ncbi:Dolichyl-P-Man:Man(7)GlcNAc(2)-PP-dolichol alpha-1,6-mannosyltransferase [Penicillium ucsense]|uniref:Mannosyltransferase n=1 Tax=Penicillium ucsense TaxID=2839758 RepID=A0A8J8WGY3_9EURO|nr:Dolichyl-P-Man:Man(7)GlcNAc(2)-PP-dolichol alpha-1,6-mannosyltransferase [Penicillium ucsense]KAF7733239.1 Dolichyl-P-Man:Man(7)GlcNAc(2)-PP-dolichol alpha-1,6-mannosyltransferase [Penicillium ucsense]
MRHAYLGLVLLLAGLILLHLLAAPYTKVEESFHVQATHDILAHGLPYGDSIEHGQYDHFDFPGAVPRTAVGATILAGLTPMLITTWTGVNQQIFIRALLGLYNALALGIFARGLRNSFGQTVAVWYLLFQCSQFHLIYYASRPLSNMFAFGLTTLAMRYLLPDSIAQPESARSRHVGVRLALCLLTVAGVIFRAEIALLLAFTTLSLLAVHGKEVLVDVVVAGVVGVLGGLLSTVGIDTIFWKKWVWPELNAFVFNVVEGQSSAWGTEPFWFYFTNALPRLLLNPLVYLIAIPVALQNPALRRPILPLLAPSVFFVALYSAQPHKEWRFILYVVPVLTATAALGAAYLWRRRDRSFFARLACQMLAVSTVASFALSTFVLLPASAANYPGAHALNALHAYHDRASSSTDPGAYVYLGNLACQTGITRFLQRPTAQGWVYDKTEDEATKSHSAGLGEPFWDQFDYVVVEASDDPEYQDPDESMLMQALPLSRWQTADVIDGFAGISILKPGSPATAQVERRILSVMGGESLYDSYVRARDVVRELVLRGWWVELKMRPRIKVLNRIRDDK